MKCAGCNKELEVGDLYIEDSPSGFMKQESEFDDLMFDDLISDILGGSGGKIFYCENCTIPGGDYMFSTVYGDEDENDIPNGT